MSKIWQKQPEEPEAQYEKFRQYLGTRSIPELARRFGVSHQGIRKTAKRWEWDRRAKAWDRRDSQSEEEESIGPVPNPTHSLPPPPPPIEPEILEGLSAVALEDQSTQMRQYSNAFRKAGKSMLAEAEQAQLLAVNARESLGLWWEVMSTDLGNREERGLDLDRAARVTRLICDLTQAYWKTIDARCKLTEGARTHWGDSAALHELIRRNFGAS